MRPGWDVLIQFCEVCSHVASRGKSMCITRAFPSIATVAFIVAAVGLTQTANAQVDCGCWIDAKTGKQVPTIPGGAMYEDAGHLHSGLEIGGGNNAHNPKTGQNFLRQPDGTWIDVKNGQCVPTI